MVGKMAQCVDLLCVELLEMQLEKKYGQRKDWNLGLPTLTVISLLFTFWVAETKYLNQTKQKAKSLSMR